MKFLLDEQLDPILSSSLGPLAERDGDQIIHMAELGLLGLEDPYIPAECRSRGIDALITANVRDFGARIEIYEALVASEISVIVVRPGHGSFRADDQLSILARHRRRIRVLLLESTGPRLVKVTPSGVRAVKDLGRLVADLQEGSSLP